LTLFSDGVRAAQSYVVGVFALAAALFAVTLRWGPAHELFDFGAFHGHDLFIAADSGLFLLLLIEGMKRIYLIRGS
jgi:hypothetical protein